MEVSIRAWLTSALLVSGCTTYPYGPVVDPDNAFLVLAAGTRGGSREFAGSDCGFTEEELDSGVIDCFSAPARVAPFKVKEALSPRRTPRHLQVVFYPTHSASARANGQYELAVLRTDGERYVLSHSRDLYRTLSGSWAFPVMDENDHEMLPCPASALVKPIDFADPQPRYSLEGNESFASSAQAKGMLVVSDGYMYPKKGIDLTDLRELFRQSPGLLNSPEAFDCEQ